MIGDKRYTEALDVESPRTLGVVEEHSQFIEAGSVTTVWRTEK